MEKKAPIDEETTLFEILLIACRYWWIILLGSIMGGLASFHLSSKNEAEYYTFTKILNPSPEVEVWIQSRPEFGATESGFRFSANAVSEKIISVQADSPELATRTLSVFMEKAVSRVVSARQRSLQSALAALRSRASDLDASIRETTNYAGRFRQETTVDQISLATLLQLLHAQQTDRFEIQREMEKIEEELSQLKDTAIFTPASPPSKTRVANPYILSALAALASGLALLVLTSLHYGIRRAAAAPRNAAKLQQLRQSLAFRRIKLD